MVHFTLCKCHLAKATAGLPGGQRLRLQTFNADCVSFIPGWGTKIPHATYQGQKNKETTSQNYASTPKTKQFHHCVKEQICVSLCEITSDGAKQNVA